MVAGEGALDEADEDVGSLLADLGAALLDGGQHRVADGGTETVGKAADAHLGGDDIAQALDHREDADGSFVIDGKERVGSPLPEPEADRRFQTPTA